MEKIIKKERKKERKFFSFGPFDFDFTFMFLAK